MAKFSAWKNMIPGLVFLVIIGFILLSSVLRYRSGEIDYLNSDATWHTLLTIECYDETSASEHLFLPIVSLGSEDDKYIPWGDAIPDEKGNYYYTSFSSAGFFAAWLFIKIFWLPVAEGSLYIFNNVLLAISTVLLMWLLSMVYQKSRHRELLCFLGGMAYIWSPEVLHGLGIVYWSQSLMQVTLLLQVIFYYRYTVKNSKGSRLLFYLMALVNPYIEWTGYVANVGFAIAELLLNWRTDRKKALGKAVTIGFITAVSFGIFSIHYLLRVDAGMFFDVLKSRFMARNVTTATMLTDVIGGYLKSFLYLWILLLIMLIWCCLRGGVNLKNGILFLVLAFPVLENVIMKQHAFAYTYDRMKAVFVLVYLICEAARNILETSAGKKTVAALVVLTMLFSAGNLHSYVTNETYIWDVDYRENNRKLAEYVTTLYPDAVYASDTNIRGYMNLLLGRGIYEFTSVDTAKGIAAAEEKKQVVYVEKEGYRLSAVTAYPVDSDKWIQYTVEDGEVIKKVKEYGIQAADLTDENWTNGYSKKLNTLLFYRNDELLISLLSHTSIVTDAGIHEIVQIDFDDSWIKVELNDDASDCMYPSVLQIE